MRQLVDIASRQLRETVRALERSTPLPSDHSHLCGRHGNPTKAASKYQ